MTIVQLYINANNNGTHIQTGLPRGNLSLHSFNYLQNDGVNTLVRVESDLLRQRGPIPYYMFYSLNFVQNIVPLESFRQSVDCSQVYINIVDIATQQQPANFVGCVLTLNWFPENE